MEPLQLGDYNVDTVQTHVSTPFLQDDTDVMTMIIVMVMMIAKMMIMKVVMMLMMLLKESNRKNV